MFKPLWSAIKIALVVGFAVWAMKRPGTIEVNWRDYSVTVDIGLILIGAVVFLLLVLGLYRLLLELFNIPKNWRQYKEKKKHHKGLRAVTLGLTALAGGDTKLASYHAHQTRKFIPNYEALSLMLEAQVARLNGKEEDAYIAFSRLLKDEDAAFMGMRGLLLMALEKKDYKRAMELIQQASKHYKRQPWVLQVEYELQIYERKWQMALRTLGRAEKEGALPAAQVRSDRVAIEILKGDQALEARQIPAAEKHYKKAMKIDPQFVPAVERLAQIYMQENKHKKVATIIQEMWKRHAHPDLVRIWTDLAPENKPEDSTVRLRWFEKLITLNPQSALGYLVAAEAAMNESLYGEAEKFLEQAEDIEQSARLYRIWATLKEHQADFDKARFYAEQAETKAGEKVWICRETGRVYERWEPISQPHGSFNTISWDDPGGVFRQERRFISNTAVRQNLPRLLTES